MIFSPSPPPDDVISVSALNRLARELLELGVPPVWISGEISNLTLAASGHAYFSLKDGSAQVRCVMFRNALTRLAAKPREGMQVELRGQVTLYEARGEFQINVETLRSAGLGRLYEAFEKLKAKLEAEGLFAAERKRALPSHPRAIGIVTSPAAAALRDVVSTLHRRMPSIPLILYPTPVQGLGAEQQIAAAIRQASARSEVDVLIVCRGGGSIEDLWAFNEEVVARAVADCRIPVVSGVGHETDFTICDFVADRRAPTPTAAAELVSPSREQLLQRVDQVQRQLERALSRLMTDKAQQLDFLSRRLVHPGERLARQRDTLKLAEHRLQSRIRAILDGSNRRLASTEARLARLFPDLGSQHRQLDQLGERLDRSMARLLAECQRRLARCEGTLTALNPNAVLARGYAIVQKADGRAVKAPYEVVRGERVTLRLAEGQTEAIIDPPQTATQIQAELPF
ncbi:exodeoxyribonuclease VII large subunit [Crenobacter sp. SG2303]|uniref:Exodeoxyribonuclease 7 large subunit n=1 Tax=Crenobacter oryzisoli TaxID=3056844 RepID=A0ABT7XUN3_9NEIS|nr:exodeoxyribonuclease VII large subunit [Crenobacter sp. SG2303]MDN0077259.1 exodeoxyribonuclease VII large subunit [Crenobacter sp. SG2303]